MGKIVKVSGPLVVATGMADANMSDVVRVGEQRLIGEILTMTGDAASIQVYEETSGLGPGAEVVTTGAPLSVELGPGLLENIYDGIQRPLEAIMAKSGSASAVRTPREPASTRRMEKLCFLFIYRSTPLRSSQGSAPAWRWAPAEAGPSHRRRLPPQCGGDPSRICCFSFYCRSYCPLYVRPAGTCGW